MSHFDRLTKISPKIYIAFEKIFQIEDLSKRMRFRDISKRDSHFLFPWNCTFFYTPFALSFLELSCDKLYDITIKISFKLFDPSTLIPFRRELKIASNVV